MAFQGEEGLPAGIGGEVQTLDLRGGPLFKGADSSFNIHHGKRGGAPGSGSSLDMYVCIHVRDKAIYSRGI